MKEFAEYLEVLEKDQKLGWAKKLHRVEDPSAPGRVTFVSTDAHTELFGAQATAKERELQAFREGGKANANGPHRVTDDGDSNRLEGFGDAVESSGGGGIGSGGDSTGHELEVKRAAPQTSPWSDAVLDEMRKMRMTIEVLAKPQPSPSRCLWTSGRKKAVSTKAASIKETDAVSATEAKMLQGETETKLTERPATQLMTQQQDQIAKLQETVNTLLAGQSQTGGVMRKITMV
jgi:hypothetical protein